MDQYIGTKILKAEPLNLGDYNKKRGWTIPEDEDPLKEGYFVEYPDGYVSWSPKDVFEESYRKTDAMNFGLALEALKAGKLVSRTGWNGKKMFLFIRPADVLETGFIPKVKSLPESVKNWIDKHLDDKVNQGEQGITPVKFGAYICMKAADNSIVNGWLASQTDMLVDDWYILD
jgi:hypothetical protein